MFGGYLWVSKAVKSFVWDIISKLWLLSSTLFDPRAGRATWRQRFGNALTQHRASNNLFALLAGPPSPALLFRNTLPLCRSLQCNQRTSMQLTISRCRRSRGSAGIFSPIMGISWIPHDRLRQTAPDVQHPNRTPRRAQTPSVLDMTMR